MKAEEAHALAVKAQAGDTEALWELVMGHHALAKRVALSFMSYDVSVDLDDRIQLCIQALAEDVVPGFDPDRGVAFTSWAQSRLRAVMLTLFRSQQRRRGRFNPLTDLEVLVEDEQVAREAGHVEAADDLERLLECPELTDRERYVLRRVAAGQAVTGLAAEMGLTREYVHRIRQKALRKLKEYASA